MSTPADEANRRRTFAIISHPDAGKTTLTEKFLLYGGALTNEAGAVKARQGRRSATSDWMALEQQRGISITSTVLQFPYREHVVNLLDTPGHRDFSEDTYRVLAAADAAVMVLDAAKGIEPQTLKLFDVCRQRGLPLLTFVNKWDRPGLDPVDLLDQLTQKLDLEPAPVTWPVGLAGDFRGVVDRRDSTFTRFTRVARGATEAPEELVPPDRAEAEEGAAWTTARDELDLLDGAGAELDRKAFLAAEATPVFFGSALTNFGVRKLLDAVIDLVPAPAPRDDVDGTPRPLQRAVLRLRVQGAGQHGSVAPRPHRLPASVLRSVRARHGRHPRHHRQAVRDEVRPPGLRPGARDHRRGLPRRRRGPRQRHRCPRRRQPWLDQPVTFPGIPSFAPEHFSVARVRDTARFKQFRKGVAQLDEEGVVQVLRDPEMGDQAPVLAAVGPMQFEVAVHRLENEFGAPVELLPTSYRLARRTDAAGAEALKGMRGVRVLRRADGTILALFESQYWVERLEHDQPDLLLERLVAEGSIG